MGRVSFNLMMLSVCLFGRCTRANRQELQPGDATVVVTSI